MTSRIDRLDLAGRDVRAAGLDHVAAPTVEVEEALVVDGERVAGAEPAVGGEHLVALAPVVPLHEQRPPEPQLALLARRAVGQRVGVHDPGLELGDGLAERPAVALGQIALVRAR